MDRCRVTEDLNEHQNALAESERLQPIVDARTEILLDELTEFEVAASLELSERTDDPIKDIYYEYQQICRATKSERSKYAYQEVCQNHKRSSSKFEALIISVIRNFWRDEKKAEAMEELGL